MIITSFIIFFKKFISIASNSINMVWLAMVFILILLLLALFLLNFYRNPERKIPHGNNIVSPADGKIIGILKVKSNRIRINKGFIGKIETLAKDVAKECYVISIFMSPFDVHVNRAPLDGKIISVRHEKGKYFAAYNIKKSLQNEKNEIVIENKRIGKIKVIQIAGFLARRIICTITANQKLNKGQRIGKIVLGSQVALVLPAERIDLRIVKGQKVIGGQTILADIR